jgi:hypothetical protein
VPDATFVAGFKAWLKLRYCPVKASKAIRITAPMPARERDPQTGEKTDETRVLVKAVPVFDRQRVAAIDGVEQTSLGRPCEPLTGDSHAHHRTHQQRRLHRSRRRARPDRPR